MRYRLEALLLVALIACDTPAQRTIEATVSVTTSPRASDELWYLYLVDNSEESIHLNSFAVTATHAGIVIQEETISSGIGWSGLSEVYDDFVDGNPVLDVSWASDEDLLKPGQSATFCFAAPDNASFGDYSLAHANVDFNPNDPLDLGAFVFGTATSGDHADENTNCIIDDDEVAEIEELARQKVELATVEQRLAEFGRLNGDADWDGLVGFSDFLILSSHFGQTGRLWSEGDFAPDGVVGFPDFLILSANFGMSVGTSPAAVPEPAAFQLLWPALFGVCLPRRRRRPPLAH